MSIKQFGYSSFEEFKGGHRSGHGQAEGVHFARPGREPTRSRGEVVRYGERCGLLRAGCEFSANRSQADPRTLIRAARDYAVERPEFALAAGMTALRGIANGWGYDITSADVLDAYAAVMAAARAAGADVEVVKADVQALIASSRSGGEFVQRVVGRQLAD